MVLESKSSQVGREPAEENNGEEGHDISKDELACGAFKCRQAERDGTGAGHGCFSYFIIGSAAGCPSDSREGLIHPSQ